MVETLESNVFKIAIYIDNLEIVIIKQCWIIMVYQSKKGQNKVKVVTLRIVTSKIVTFTVY